jgi:hypothetical protein
MKTWGWIEADIELAAARASEITGTCFYVCDMRDNSSSHPKRGGEALQFKLKPATSARRKDGTYPPGVMVRGIGTNRERSGRAVCWHTFGHFMRALFQINGNGLISTMVAVYDTVQGFNEVAYATGTAEKGSQAVPEAYRECCYCEDQGIGRF